MATTGGLAGSYATNICALSWGTTGSGGATLAWPTIALTSSAGKCNFVTSAGFLNFGLFSVSGFGTIIGGPLAGNSGPVAVNLLAGLAGLTLTNPATAPNAILQIGLNLVGLFGVTIDVPDGDSLVLWIQDNPAQTGAGTMQYWIGSFDERNLCSSYSFMFSGGSGAAFSFPPSFEWDAGLGTLDATATTAITSLGAGPSGLNANDALQGFSPGFDQGSGTRTVSITGTGGTGIGSASIGSETLGVAVYDEDNPHGGSPRLAMMNASGLDVTGAATCDNRSATFLVLPTGGAGGPTLVPFLATQPRSVGKLDAVALQLVGNGIWVAATNHTTTFGGINFPYFPAAAGISGSNMSGFNGGFGIPLPALPALIGVEVFTWNWAVDATNSFLDFAANDGHGLSNGYPFMFHP